MWGAFALVCLASLVLLYVPGHVFLRGLRLPRILATCCAPLYSVAMYAGLPLVLEPLGIRCSPPSVLGPTLVLALVAWLVGRFGPSRERRTPDVPHIGDVSFGRCHAPFDLVAPAIFVLAATLVCAFVFLGVLPDAAAFAQRNDNQTHLNILRAFIDSGRWSSLHASIYQASPPNAWPNVGGSGFYPCAWSCVVVLTHLLTHADLMMCANAVIATVSSVVFPLGMFAFMRVLMPDRPRAIALGAVAATGFANWPWFFLQTGPLYPNQFGVSLECAALAVMLSYIDGNRLVGPPVTFAALAAMSFVSLGLAHPTTVFSAYVFVGCYGIHAIRCLHDVRRRRIILLAYCGVVVGTWLAFFSIPFLQGAISYVENERIGLPEALHSLIGLDLTFTGEQLGMLVCSAMGCAWVFRRKELRWLLAPVAIFAVGYIATRVDWWPVKHWFASLWYSDCRRMATNLTIFLMPITALGLDAMLPANIASAASRRDRARIAVFVALLAIVYVPRFPIPGMGGGVETPLGTAERLMRRRYEERIYDPQEVAFVNRVRDAIEPGALVINIPADGSMWAYGVNGVNTYFRDLPYEQQTADARLIRQRLREYASDSQVRKAVARTGATYVLLLDKGLDYEQGDWLWQFASTEMPAWNGINLIGDHTPGFTPVLAEGDQMRLYRIDALNGKVD